MNKYVDCIAGDSVILFLLAQDGERALMLRLCDDGEYLSLGTETGWGCKVKIPPPEEYLNAIAGMLLSVLIELHSQGYKRFLLLETRNIYPLTVDGIVELTMFLDEEVRKLDEG